MTDGLLFKNINKKKCKNKLKRKNNKMLILFIDLLQGFQYLIFYIYNKNFKKVLN